GHQVALDDVAFGGIDTDHRPLSIRENDLPVDIQSENVVRSDTHDELACARPKHAAGDDLEAGTHGRAALTDAANHEPYCGGSLVGSEPRRGLRFGDRFAVRTAGDARRSQDDRDGVPRDMTGSS